MGDQDGLFHARRVSKREESAQSMTGRSREGSSDARQRPGVRWPSTAFPRAASHRQSSSHHHWYPHTAPEDWRTPKRSRARMTRSTAATVCCRWEAAEQRQEVAHGASRGSGENEISSGRGGRNRPGVSVCRCCRSLNLFNRPPTAQAGAPAHHRCWLRPETERPPPARLREAELRQCANAPDSNLACSA